MDTKSIINVAFNLHSDRWCVLISNHSSMNITNANRRLIHKNGSMLLHAFDMLFFAFCIYFKEIINNTKIWPALLCKLLPYSIIADIKRENKMWQ